MDYYNEQYPDDLFPEHEHYVYFRYGRRTLHNKIPCIAACLCDLGKLPYTEQLHWRANELENPQFLVFDVDFKAYINRAFYGNWTKSNDPLKRITEVLSSINATCPDFFRNLENRHLTYPYLNNQLDFDKSCSELYKLIDSANINRKVLEKLLKDIYNINSDKLVHESGREFSPIQVLYVLIEKLFEGLGILEVGDYKSLWNEIKDARTRSDHGLPTYGYDSTNYLQKFKQVLHHLFYLLEWINTRLKNIIEGVEY